MSFLEAESSPLARDHLRGRERIDRLAQYGLTGIGKLLVVGACDFQLVLCLRVGPSGHLLGTGSSSGGQLLAGLELQSQRETGCADGGDEQKDGDDAHRQQIALEAAAFGCQIGDVDDLVERILGESVAGCCRIGCC